MGRRPECHPHEEAHAQARGAVELRAVTRRYGRSAHALRGIDLTLAHRTFTAVMGPSGSGKSTLLQCAAGLDRPTSGTVHLAGTEISSLGETELTVLRRTRLGFVFQAFNLLPALTAEQNVLLPLRLAGRRADRGSAAEALERVGLAEYAGRRPDQLSGGQQQRVALARALVTRPDVIFADEPTGALDTGTATEVLTLLRNAVDAPAPPAPSGRGSGTSRRGSAKSAQGNASSPRAHPDGGTVVMVTHDPAAAAHADRVLFLADGALAGHLERDPSLAPPQAAERIAARMTQLTGAAPRDPRNSRERAVA